MKIRMSSQIKCWSTVILLMTAALARGQMENLGKCAKFLQNGNLDSARFYIDFAAQAEVTKVDGQTWYLRGFTYKEIYKTRELKDKRSPARIESFHSFVKSITLDTSRENKDNNNSNIKFLATKFFNDAAETLDSVYYKLSIENFDHYKECMRAIDASINLNQKDIEYCLALGGVYMKIFESNRKKNMTSLDLAKGAYNHVLGIDPNNVSANYNMGVLFYNHAVSIINSMDYDFDLVAVSDIQDNSIVLFKQSLPFMEKAYELDPKKKETIRGLAGIYFSLNDFEKSNDFKRKLEDMEKNMEKK